jgi:hypothetical protein
MILVTKQHTITPIPKHHHLYSTYMTYRINIPLQQGLTKGGESHPGIPFW